MKQKTIDQSPPGILTQQQFYAQFKTEEFWLAMLTEAVENCLQAIKQGKPPADCFSRIIRLQESVFCCLISPLFYADTLLDLKKTIVNGLFGSKSSYYQKLFEAMEEIIIDFCEKYSQWYHLFTLPSKKIKNTPKPIEYSEAEVQLEKSESRSSSTLGSLIGSLGAVAIVANQFAVVSADNLQEDAEVDRSFDEQETNLYFPAESALPPPTNIDENTLPNQLAILGAQRQLEKSHDNHEIPVEANAVIKPKKVRSVFKKSQYDPRHPEFLRAVCNEVIKNYVKFDLNTVESLPINSLAKAIITHGFSPTNNYRSRSNLAWYPVPRDGSDPNIVTLWSQLRQHSQNSPEIDKLYAEFLAGNNDCFLTVSMRYGDIRSYKNGMETQISYATVWALLAFRSGDVAAASYLGESLSKLKETDYIFPPEISGIILDTHASIEKHIDGYPDFDNAPNLPFIYLTQLQHEAVCFAAYHKNPMASAFLGVYMSSAESRVDLSYLRRAQAYFAQALCQSEESFMAYSNIIMSTENLLTVLAQSLTENESLDSKGYQAIVSEIEQNHILLEILIRVARKQMALQKAKMKVGEYFHDMVILEARLEQVTKTLETIDRKTLQKKPMDSDNNYGSLLFRWIYFYLLLIGIMYYAINRMMVPVEKDTPKNVNKEPKRKFFYKDHDKTSKDPMPRSGSRVHTIKKK